MSYAQRKELTGNRTFSMVMTALVVGGLMYTIVTGLAYQVVKEAVTDLKVVDIEEPPPPPPEEPPPPPKDIPDVPPPPMTPPPVVRINTPPPPIQTVEAPPNLPTTPPPVIAAPRPPPPPAPAPAPAPRKVQSAQSARGDLRKLFSGDDYPAAAMSSGAEGTSQAQLTIGPDGRVTGCNIIRSAGNSSLDSATCSILRRRAKFTPARDSNGNATSDTITTPPITWRLES